MVNVAKIIGLNLYKRTEILESRAERFSSLSSYSILSTKTMALLMKIPASEITPRKTMDPKKK